MACPALLGVVVYHSIWTHLDNEGNLRQKLKNTLSPPLSLEDKTEGGGWDGEGSKNLEEVQHLHLHHWGVGDRRRVSSGRQSSCSTVRLHKRRASRSRSRRAVDGGDSPFEAGRDWI